ncbi:GNAT family N-acetyltransferase [Falsarthrobacter nasiphocae]|uniref:RimJ/RimL family protein N-acetyltransferase n=1 Tax=Falsarthrobacter nasiphocae TaxID=189863 RepID=A0AAE3YI55_9MICC|nr:GNAT family N-acetyltransferase [Falsarthrobacter nasiphocae]MDR6892640.1 RimJ/RimL family protein N-acetyltransferase [Falsarthrobacter nasiphocae]
MTFSLHLRPVEAPDLDAFFEHQKDQDANHMAAFGAKNPHDRGVFDLHWQGILDDESISARTIDVDGTVAGHVLRYTENDGLELSYWLGREFWGRGITTEAVGQFLKEFPERPLRARAVADNEASIRILTGHGFVETDETRSFSTSRGEVVREVILELN